MVKISGKWKEKDNDGSTYEKTRVLDNQICKAKLLLCRTFLFSLKFPKIFQYFLKKRKDILMIKDECLL